jgi:hypothetical protein
MEKQETLEKSGKSNIGDDISLSDFDRCNRSLFQELSGVPKTYKGRQGEVKAIRGRQTRVTRLRSKRNMRLFLLLPRRTGDEDELSRS